MTYTKSQLRAIQHTSGPCVIIAGAGTGKTTTMQGKIAHLLGNEVQPDRILALAFSTEAVHALKRKLVEARLSSAVIVNTFHGFCFSLLEEHGGRLGIGGEMKVFQEEDLALLLFEQGLEKSSAKRFANTIVKAKDNNITKQQYEQYVQQLKQSVQTLDPDEAAWSEHRKQIDLNLKTFHLLDTPTQRERKEEKKQWQEFIDAYDEFEQYKALVDAWSLYERERPTSAIDFADMQLKVLELLNKYGTELLPPFEHIIIDEFQDTSVVQFELIKLLGERTRNITIVGDRNQSIYAFRGAFTDNVDEFISYFDVPREAIFALDQSFRSTQHILDASHQLILNNYPEERREDCIRLLSHTGSLGAPVTILDCVSDLEEARAVAERIMALLDGGTPAKEIAVLFRSYRQSQLLQDELVRRQIPFTITSSEVLFHKPYVKTILAYLHAIAHLQQPIAKGNEAFWRLFHYHDSLSTEDTHALGNYLKHHKDLQISDLVFNKPSDLVISSHGQAVFTRVKERIELLGQEAHHLPNLVLRIMEYTGLSRQFSHLRTVENVEALMHLRDFHGIVKDFAAAHGDDLHRFIEYLELLDELDAPPRATRQERTDCLRLLSMHAAKGLEFEHVFVLGFYDKKFPLAHGGAEPLIPPELNPQLRQLFAAGNVPTNKEIQEEKRERKLQEERRLCYVAMTRAKRHLVLSCAKTYHDKDIDVSAFLKELGYLDWRDNPELAGTEHVEYVPDLDERAQPPAAEGKIETFKRQHRKLLLESMDERPKDAIRELLAYMGLSGAQIEELKELSPLVPELDIAQEQAKCAANTFSLTFDPKAVEFSYSGLKTFKECPKKYELKTVLRLPSRDEDDPDAPTSVGSFIHEVLEAAIKRKVQSLEELNLLMDELAGTQQVDKNRCRQALAVFWERNNDRIDGPHEIEKYFSFEEEGVRFHGFVDRTDEVEDGLEIIDYKTGREPDALSRSWQLSMYAYAADRVLGKKAKILTLELLEQEKPRRFIVQADGTATPLSARTTPFNIHDMMKEMVTTAKGALTCYTQGFPETKDDFICSRCEHKLYCPKWG